AVSLHEIRVLLGFPGVYIERKKFSKWGIRQGCIGKACDEMRLVRIFTNANKARVPQEMLHPAEIEAGLVKIIAVYRTAVEEPDPGGMSVLLKVLPILDIDPHDPVDVRDREPQFSAGRENTKPATQNDRDFCVGKMLEHVARVNRLREAIGK